MISSKKCPIYFIIHFTNIEIFECLFGVIFIFINYVYIWLKCNVITYVY